MRRARSPRSSAALLRRRGAEPTAATKDTRPERPSGVRCRRRLRPKRPPPLGPGLPPPWTPLSARCGDRASGPTQRESTASPATKGESPRSCPFDPLG
ncbi:hypothetical protein MRX96_016613 [Rhipicephalus microplus]